MQGEEATSFQSLGALGPQNSISEALGVPLFWAMLEVSPAPPPSAPTAHDWLAIGWESATGLGASIAQQPQPPAPWAVLGTS